MTSCLHTLGDCCMTLVVECTRCRLDIPARRVPLVKVTCPNCGTRMEVNMEREDPT